MLGTQFNNCEKSGHFAEICWLHNGDVDVKDVHFKEEQIGGIRTDNKVQGAASIQMTDHQASTFRTTFRTTSTDLPLHKDSIRPIAYETEIVLQGRKRPSRLSGISTKFSGFGMDRTGESTAGSPGHTTPVPSSTNYMGPGRRGLQRDTLFLEGDIGVYLGASLQTGSRKRKQEDPFQ